jgi:signal transduction histidine kinase
MAGTAFKISDMTGIHRFLQFFLNVCGKWVILIVLSISWPQVSAQEIRTTVQAELISPRGERMVTLPHQLPKEDFSKKGSKVVYRVSLHLNEIPESQLGIYIRKMSLAGRLFINGRQLGQCELGDLENLRCLNRPYLFVPPLEYWSKGLNQIEVEIFASGRQINGLSAVVVGDAEQLMKEFYRPAYFWLVDVMNVHMWVSLILGLMALAVAWLVRDSRLYLWVGLSSVVGALSKTTLLETHPWISIEFFTWLAYAFRIVVIPLVYLAILGFFEQAKFFQKIQWPLFAYAAIAPGIMWVTGLDLRVISLLYLPLMLMGCVLLVLVSKWTYDLPKPSHLVISAVIGALVAMGILDWVRINGARSFDGVFLIPYGHSGLSLIFSAVLLGKVIQSFRAFRANEKLLVAQFVDSSRELRVAQDRISEMERTLLKLTENIPVGTYVLETNAESLPRFTFVSDRWLRMLNLDRASVLNDPTQGFKCVHPDDFDEFMALNQRVFANVESFKWIGRILVNNEVRWLSVESVPRKLSHGGAAWEGVMIDITDMKESEFALKLAHERLTASEVERSALEERERLLQDMHDGFGSQLSSARIMAEQGTLDQPQLKELLQECMSDLYLVVDTLGSNGKTLAVAIGDFRFRTDRRTSGLRSKIHWDLRLDHLPPIPDRKILQILRILQEALSNALKHSGGLNIWVNAVFLPDQNLLRLSVADDGVGMSQKPQQGRGLSSMKQRAREIGGSLYFSDPSSGTQVVIELSDFA